jgi:hypothetical protein
MADQASFTRYLRLIPSTGPALFTISPQTVVEFGDIGGLQTTAEGWTFGASGRSRAIFDVSAQTDLATCEVLELTARLRTTAPLSVTASAVSAKSRGRSLTTSFSVDPDGQDWSAAVTYLYGPTGLPNHMSIVMSGAGTVDLEGVQGRCRMAVSTSRPPAKGS